MTDLPIKCTIEQLKNWLTALQTDRPIKWLTYQSNVWLNNWTTDCLSVWLANWLTDWLTGWLTDQMTDRLTDQLFIWLTLFSKIRECVTAVNALNKDLLLICNWCCFFSTFKSGQNNYLPNSPTSKYLLLGEILPSIMSSAKDLGVVLDQQPTLYDHVLKTTILCVKPHTNTFLTVNNWRQ